MSIAFDAYTADDAPGTSSASWSHACAGSDRVLAVLPASRSFEPAIPTGITYNGVSLTEGASLVSGTSAASAWYLVAPASGSNTIQVTSPDQNVILGQAVSLTGVDQSAPIDVAGTNSGSGTTPTISVSTSEANSWVLDIAALEADYDMAVGAGQTKRGDMQYASFPALSAAISTEGPVSAGSTTMDWTSSSDNWFSVALGFAAAATAGEYDESISEGAESGESFSGANAAEESISEGAESAESLTGALSSTAAIDLGAESDVDLSAAVLGSGSETEAAESGEEMSASLNLSGSVVDGAIAGASWSAAIVDQNTDAIADEAEASDEFVATLIASVSVSEGAAPGEAFDPTLQIEALLSEAAAAGEQWIGAGATYPPYETILAIAVHSPSVDVTAARQPAISVAARTPALTVGDA